MCTFFAYLVQSVDQLLVSIDPPFCFLLKRERAGGSEVKESKSGDVIIFTLRTAYKSSEWEDTLIVIVCR